MNKQQALDLMTRLDASDEGSQHDLLAEVDAERHELTSALVHAAGNAKSASARAAALFLIGRHHLVHAIGELIRQIDFEHRGRVGRGPEPLWERYPAMEALIAIGKPAIPATLKLLGRDDSELRRDLAVKVLRYVEGAELARFILERQLARAPDLHERWQDALARLAQLPPDQAE